LLKLGIWGDGVMNFIPAERRKRQTLCRVT